MAVMRIIGTGFIVMLAVSCGGDAEPPAPTISINDLMTNIVTPATNTLWGVEDPQTDEEWKVLEDAALETIRAGRQAQRGGTGPNDNTWAADEVWQGYAREMTAAAEAGLEAIRARNLDALFEANDVLYPPCENCHLKFHPGVAQ
jgi:cytochrome c556